MHVQVPFFEKGNPVNDEVAYLAQTFASTVFVTQQGQIINAARCANTADASATGTSDNLNYRFASEPLDEVWINLTVDEDGLDG